jgi:hypothetical protein
MDTMGKVYSSSLNSVKGTFVVDIRGYDESVQSYLMQRGAVEWTGYYYSRSIKGKNFKSIHFPGSKPMHHGLDYTRLFMPSEDEALLFSLAFGHLIISTHVKSIQQLIDNTNEQTNY